MLRPRVEKVMVSGRDATKLADGVLGQVELVRAALGDESLEVSILLLHRGGLATDRSVLLDPRHTRRVTPQPEQNPR